MFAALTRSSASNTSSQDAASSTRDQNLNNSTKKNLSNSGNQTQSQYPSSAVPGTGPGQLPAHAITHGNNIRSQLSTETGTVITAAASTISSGNTTNFNTNTSLSVIGGGNTQTQGQNINQLVSVRSLQEINDRNYELFRNSGFINTSDEEVKVSHANLATLCTPPFLKLEKHAYCTTDLVILERFCTLLKTDLFDDLGRIYLRMMKMLHLCEYPMVELVSILAHASGYFETAYSAIVGGSQTQSQTGNTNPTGGSASASSSSESKNNNNASSSTLNPDAIESKDVNGNNNSNQNIHCQDSTLPNTYSSSSSTGALGPSLGPGTVAGGGSVAQNQNQTQTQSQPGHSGTAAMGRLEKANVITILCFLAHCYVQDECCPLRVWHNYLFKKYCCLKTLNKAVVRLLLLVNSKLRVNDVEARFMYLMEQRFTLMDVELLLTHPNS